MSPGRRIRVLVVDDSAVVRKILIEAISAEPDLEVVGSAPDPFTARDKIVALKPDVLTLDIEMPRMDGLTFLRKLMRYHPLPVIVISSLAHSSCQASLDALQSGAVEVLGKPFGPYSVGDLRLNLAAKIRAAAAAGVSHRRTDEFNEAGSAPKTSPPASHPPVAPFAASFKPEAIIAIGASTGGTEAIQQILTQMPLNCPPIVITQHIPPVFSAALANRLNESCVIAVKEACDGDIAQPGQALLAPGNFHMLVRRVSGTYRVQIKDGPPVCYQRPSVDVLFQSVTEAAGKNAVAALLTGMGSDGAQGLLALRRAGARTIAQNQASCVVFGMPKEAIRLGAAELVLPLRQIPSGLLDPARQQAF